ncbi:MAG: hypothetical protein NZL92_05445 [Gloeomargarita sp. SKYG116]|nr:hypothetical protein [Gloeomargarita sp. SKYG116]MCS7225422.1 hypothetical protein [Gloeomargarita sp. SKYB31]MDW8401122.1 hypothetical protein [Gloeomargarita sp. SKYGB_i_bin116]
MKFVLTVPALLSLIWAAPVLATEPTVVEAGNMEVAQAPKRRGLWSELNLTPEQLQRIQQIRANARVQMQQVLTPEQRQLLSQAQGQSPAERRRIIRALNLTEAQKEQMRLIRANTRQQIEAVLTPEQRQQLELRRQRRGGPKLM